jgi:thiamine biosynthesis lipoprotein
MAFSARLRKYLIIFLILGWSLTLIGYFVFSPNKYACFKKKKARLYSANRLLMGTFWEVTSTHKEAGEIVFSEAKRIENLLSKYIKESEISRLNRAGKLKVSPDTFYIIKKSKEFWQQSNGAFDITAAVLVELWGFNNHEYRIPDQASIKRSLKLVGSDKIILHEKDNVVEFKLSGMKIDLGGIAKGFALDCAVARLKENKIDNCLINAGGQVYALGTRPEGKWRVAVLKPRKHEFSKIIELNNRSISTSGDYEQFFLKDGKRYCHIINPKTGYPVDSGIFSVTVIDNSALTADALSTAAFILGKEEVEMLKKKFPKTEFFIN